MLLDLIFNGFRTRKCQLGQNFYVGVVEIVSSNTPQKLLDIHCFEKEWQMANSSLASSILPVIASLCAGSNAPVFLMEHAVKSIVGMSACLYKNFISQQGYSMLSASVIEHVFAGAQKAARIGLEDAIVLKVNAEVGNAHALQLDVNVIQMFAGIVGSGKMRMVHLLDRDCLFI